MPEPTHDRPAASEREQERLLTLWVTLPNYVRIVYGFVPPWGRSDAR